MASPFDDDENEMMDMKAPPSAPSVPSGPSASNIPSGSSAPSGPSTSNAPEKAVSRVSPFYKPERSVERIIPRWVINFDSKSLALSRASSISFPFNLHL